MLTNFTEQTMVDALPVGACIFTGPELIIKAVNEPMLAIWAKDASVIGKSLYDAIPELKNQTVFEEQMNDVYRTGHSFNNPSGQAELLVNGSLQTAYFNYSFKPLYDSEGNIYGIVNTAVNTTAQVLERRLRKEIEERLGFALNAAEVGTWDMDIAQQLVKWDERCKQLFGFSKDDIISYDEVLRYVHPGDRRRVDDAVMYALQPVSGGHYDIRFRTIGAEDGVLRWLHCKGKAYFDAANEPYRFSGTAQNITVEKIQKEKLRQVQAQFDSAFANSAVGMVITDTEGRFLQGNRTYANITGYTLQELTATSYKDLTHPEDLPANTSKLEQLSRGEIPFFDIVKRYVRKNGDTIWIRMNVSSIKDADDQAQFFIGVALDITAEKEAQERFVKAYEQQLILSREQANSNEQLLLANKELLQLNNLLAVNENKFRAIFEQTPLAIGLLIGDDLTIAEVNDNALKLWGYTREAIINKPFRQARPELNDQPFINYVEETYRSGNTFRYSERKIYLLRDGKPEPFYLSSVYQPIRNDAGKVMGLLLIMEDVTERVISRQTAGQANEQLHLAIESTNLGTWYLNTATQEFIASVRLKELFGYYPDEAMSFDDAINQISEEYRKPVLAAVEASITQGQAYQLEYPVIGLHDKKLRWVKATGKSYPGTDTNEAFFAGTMLDITEQKQDEQRKNDFISMVSHELKTPLTSMGGYVQLLQVKARNNDDTSTTNMLEKANNQLKKMTTMINGFLNVSRLESGKIYIDTQRFDMAVLMKEVEEETQSTVSNHKMVFEPVEETFVQADRDKIAQVISNFISNADKYSANGTTIQVACVTKDGMALVSVKDEGMGVATQDKEKLFDRFYRAQNQQMGTIAGFGIGLYLCAEIIKRHGGHIGVESEPAKGSTFWFTLPVEV